VRPGSNVSIPECEGATHRVYRAECCHGPERVT
jgi:hypothetical protein